MDLKIYRLERNPMTVTRQLTKSGDFRQIQLCDFHLWTMDERKKEAESNLGWHAARGDQPDSLAAHCKQFQIYVFLKKDLAKPHSQISTTYSIRNQNYNILFGIMIFCREVQYTVLDAAQEANGMIKLFQ